MNIVIHTGFAFPRGNACANRMRVFYQVFKSAGHNVKVLAPEDGDIGSGVDPNDVLFCDTYKLETKTVRNRLKNNLTFACSSLRKARGLDHVDVVITTSPPPLISVSGWMIAKKHRAKLVYDVRDVWPEVALEMGSFSEHGIYCAIFRWIAKFMYHNADLILTVSPGKVKKIQKYIQDKSKVKLFENGLDEEFLKHVIDDSVIEKYNMKNRFNCVYIGNVGLAQGLGHLLELAEVINNPKVQFLVFGDGAEKKELEKIKEIKALDNVHFMGNINEREVFNVLRNAQLSYIPLVNANLRDSIPTKTYEALGVGCPVLMSAEGDAVSLVRESKLGWVLSPDDINELPTMFNTILEEYNVVIKNKEFAIRNTLKLHSRQVIAKRLLCELSEGEENG